MDELVLLDGCKFGKIGQRFHALHFAGTPTLLSTLEQRVFQGVPEQIRRINQLIRDIQRNPFDGLGKPEPLKHELSGAWSRRITDEHRLVYRIEGEQVIILQCRFHY
jgi:toxin YoeB